MLLELNTLAKCVLCKHIKPIGVQHEPCIWHNSIVLFNASFLFRPNWYSMQEPVGYFHTTYLLGIYSDIYLDRVVIVHEDGRLEPRYTLFMYTIGLYSICMQLCLFQSKQIGLHLSCIKTLYCPEKKQMSQKSLCEIKWKQLLFL